MNINTRAAKQLQSNISSKLNDGKIDNTELAKLNVDVQKANVPASEKKAFMQLAQKINKATTNGFFQTDKVTPNEMKSIENLASQLKGSKLVDKMMADFKKNQPQKLEQKLESAPVRKAPQTGGLGEAIANFFNALFGGGASSTKKPSGLSTPKSYNAPANQMSFGSGARTNSTSRPASVNRASSANSVSSASATGDNAFVFQFSQGTAKEKQANCGAACAAMQISALGVSPLPSMGEIRRSVGARSGNGSGPFAMSTDQVNRAVEKYTGKKPTTTTLPRSASAATQDIAAQLRAGKKVTLLSGGIGGSKGHYMVVKSVNPDGSLTLDDPGSRNGEGRTISAAKFAEMMQTRRNAGRANQILTV